MRELLLNKFSPEVNRSGAPNFYCLVVKSTIMSVIGPATMLIFHPFDSLKFSRDLVTNKLRVIYVWT